MASASPPHGESVTVKAEPTPAVAIKMEAAASDAAHRRRVAVSIHCHLRSSRKLSPAAGEAVEQDAANILARPMQRNNVGRAAAVRDAAAPLACVSRPTGIHPLSPGSTEGGCASAPAMAPPVAPLRTAAPTAFVGAVGSGHDCVPAVANASLCPSDVAAVLACGAAAPDAVGPSAAPPSAVPAAAVNTGCALQAVRPPTATGQDPEADLTIAGIRSYTPAQVAEAVAAVACIHLSVERQVDLTRAIFLAAEEGVIDGNVVLCAPEEDVVASLLSLSRRTCRGTIPFGTRVRVLRFVRAQRLHAPGSSS